MLILIIDEALWIFLCNEEFDVLCDESVGDVTDNETKKLLVNLQKN